MSARESLSDVAVSTIAKIEEARKATEQFIDYGLASGFNTETDQLVNDAFAQLGALRARASQLLQRLRRTEKEKAEKSKPVSKP